MNVHFESAAKAVKSLNKKGVSLWTSLVMFVATYNSEQPVQPDKGTDLKPVFKGAEKQATSDHRVEMGKNSTYRVAKGVLVQAVKMGIDILDEKGKPRGKTDLENDIKANKEEKPALEKLKTTLATASALVDQCDAHERITAAKLIQELLDQSCRGISLAA